MARDIKINGQVYNDVPAVQFPDVDGKIYYQFYDTTSTIPASADQILSGQEAYVNGSKVTGSMPDRGSASITITSTVPVSLSAGYYSGGSIGVNTTDIESSKIKSGCTILGVSGSYTGEAPGELQVDPDNVASGVNYYYSDNGIDLQTGTGTLYDGRTFTPSISSDYGAVYYTNNQIIFNPYVDAIISSGNGLGADQGLVTSAIGLTSAKVVGGYTIAGVTGASVNMDTSSSTPAAATQVLSGREAFVNGAKITGSMTNNGSATISVTSTATVSIPAGYYDGTGYVSVDTTDIAAENIKSGCTILGVSGTYTSASISQDSETGILTIE